MDGLNLTPDERLMILESRVSRQQDEIDDLRADLAERIRLATLGDEGQ